MKILLYGGTFDPPHVGHIHNLETAAQSCMPDRIVIMPAGVPPHKAASSTPAEIRLQMCRCFCEDAALPKETVVEVSDWEIRRAAEGEKNYSLFTLQMLASKYPGAELYMAIGSDLLTTFTQWYQWQELLHLCTLVVQSRDLGDLPELEKAAEQLKPFGGKVLLSVSPAIEVSSTQIRNGEAGADMIPDSIQLIIKRYSLYHHKEALT